MITPRRMMGSLTACRWRCGGDRLTRSERSIMNRPKHRTPTHGAFTGKLACRTSFLRWKLVGALLATVTSGFGDTVYLRSGEKLIGKIITDERAKLVIKSQA